MAMDPASIQWIIKNKDDYYQILAVSRTADATEIRRAYRKKVLLLHPDKSPGAEAGEACRAINKAYEVLRDDDARLHYDLLGSTSLTDRQSLSLLVSYLIKWVLISVGIAHVRRRSGEGRAASMRPWASRRTVSVGLTLFWLVAALGFYSELNISPDAAVVEFNVYWDCLAASVRGSVGSFDAAQLHRCQAQRKKGEKRTDNEFAVRAKVRSEEEGVEWFREHIVRRCHDEDLLQWASEQRFEQTSVLRTAVPLPPYVRPSKVNTTWRKYKWQDWQPKFTKDHFSVEREEDLFRASAECQKLKAARLSYPNGVNR